MATKPVTCKHCGERIMVPVDKRGFILLDAARTVTEGWALQAKGRAICPSCILVPEAAL